MIKNSIKEKSSPAIRPICLQHREPCVLQEGESPVEQVVEPARGKAGGGLVHRHPGRLHSPRKCYQVVTSNLVAGTKLSIQERAIHLNPVPVSISNVVANVVQIVRIFRLQREPTSKAVYHHLEANLD